MSGRHATSCHACAISVGRSTKLKKTRTRPHHPGPFKEWQHPIVVDTGIIKLMTCSNIFTSVLAWSQAPQACSTSCLAHRFVQGSTTGNRLMISNRNMFHQGGSGRSDQATKSSGLSRTLIAVLAVPLSCSLGSTLSCTLTSALNRILATTLSSTLSCILVSTLNSTLGGSALSITPVCTLSGTLVSILRSALVRALSISSIDTLSITSICTLSPLILRLLSTLLASHTPSTSVPLVRPILHKTISIPGSKILSGSKSGSRTTSRLARLRSTRTYATPSETQPLQTKTSEITTDRIEKLTLNTTGHTRLVASRRPNSLGVATGRRHVGINIRQHIDTPILINQVDILARRQPLHTHLLQLIHHILKTPTSSQRAIRSNHIGLATICSIDDGLVRQLVHFGVEGYCRSLLECNVVLDAGPGVEEVRDHGCVCLPV
ncbi:hypothetical protein IAQ61_007318 [Plenodomus lingam]|uniref:uncharacterized protein n=1 Tax=Leptosphaeria maculans TaxID=5022 RepID=UPI00331A6EAD|nr:hypothetical protein IAQ61_007318 [Plenodomus lingam]